MPRHDKLVRDLIPEQLAARGVRHEVRVLPHPQYADALRAKLMEEVGEYLSASTGEERLAELADVQEVVNTLARLDGVTPADLDRLRSAKATRNGAFERRLLLVESD